MINIKFHNYIEEYWEEAKDNFDVDFKQFKLACETPFKFVKEKISIGCFKNIRLQYFGIFNVVGGRLKYYKKILKEKLSEGKIDKEHYDKKIRMLNNYES